MLTMHHLVSCLWICTPNTHLEVVKALLGAERSWEQLAIRLYNPLAHTAPVRLCNAGAHRPRRVAGC